MFVYIYSYGSVSSSKAIIDQKSGECKGYGFAMFEKEQDCEEAIEGLNKSGLQASYARVGQVVGHFPFLKLQRRKLIYLNLGIIQLTSSTPSR